MKIKWLGHSCFLLTAEDGTKVLLDPFDATVGYPVPEVAADIVTTSHDHHDHNYIKAVKGSFKHISQAGQYREKGIDIKGVFTAHDEDGGAQRGMNVVFKFIINGIAVCHCGDLGHVLTSQQVTDIGSVDVLLVPVGGFYTIDYAAAAQVCSLLKPTIIIPMHYKTPAVAYPIAGVDGFLKQMGMSKQWKKQEVEITKGNLASLAGVLVLEYQ